MGSTQHTHTCRAELSSDFHKHNSNTCNVMPNRNTSNSQLKHDSDSNRIRILRSCMREHIYLHMRLLFFLFFLLFFFPTKKECFRESFFGGKMLCFSRIRTYLHGNFLLLFDLIKLLSCYPFCERRKYFPHTHTHTAECS